MLEHLFDESLLVALRNVRREMDPNDIHEAKLTEELGFKQPVVYTESDRVAVATHEAGHATVAYFLGKGGSSVLSIIKRRASLGLLAHGDEEEQFTRTRSEVESAMLIALGGLVAEELFFGESGTGPPPTSAARPRSPPRWSAPSACPARWSATTPSPRARSGRRTWSDACSGHRREGPGRGDPRRAEGVSSPSSRSSATSSSRSGTLIARDELVGEEIAETIEVAIASRN